jgi:hypothetical protein
MVPTRQRRVQRGGHDRLREGVNSRQGADLAPPGSNHAGLLALEQPGRDRPLDHVTTDHNEAEAVARKLGDAGAQRVLAGDGLSARAFAPIVDQQVGPLAGEEQGDRSANAA